MKKIDNLSTIEGRKLLQDVFRELRYEKQYSGIATLFICWRICTHERNINRFINKDVTLLHSLGFFAGTGLWMEEVVNRFYYSTINSFVYFGAALLLILIGIRRFSSHVTNTMVIGGIAFEALMLICMFIVMLFTPNDDISSNGNGETGEISAELLGEIGEISRDFAAAVLQLESLSSSIVEMNEKQSRMIDKMAEIVNNSALAISPNIKMLEIMKETNIALIGFQNNVRQLTDAASLLRKEEIEMSVRKEVERVLVQRAMK
ncbi:MAG: hypothetical protein QG635_847 [Bacteroidota bacterium]|nr:hypothetical protein [Bacteroidota bacterium]